MESSVAVFCSEDMPDSNIPWAKREREKDEWATHLSRVTKKTIKSNAVSNQDNMTAGCQSERDRWMHCERHFSTEMYSALDVQLTSCPRIWFGSRPAWCCMSDWKGPNVRFWAQKMYNHSLSILRIDLQCHSTHNTLRDEVDRYPRRTSRAKSTPLRDRFSKILRSFSANMIHVFFGGLVTKRSIQCILLIQNSPHPASALELATESKSQSHRQYPKLLTPVYMHHL